LNTYLFSKPSFTSPQPLAAASGLTIPLQITLSEIKLSAFIILVFSRQKGLTLVFRNDPLESLKVSSTFDSIQFVRDYLQRTIEGKLRDLMMDELPAIIHKLSLQLWCGSQSQKDANVSAMEDDEPAVNPFDSPPLDAVDGSGNLLDSTELASLSADGNTDGQSLFSQHSLLRLAALTGCQRTFSLFTPGIQDAVFRAWAGPYDRSDTSSPMPTPRLMKSLSFTNALTVHAVGETSPAEPGHLPSRPSLLSLGSDTTGLHLSGGGRSRSYNGRKRKTRVVNLRKKKGDATDDTRSEASETAETMSDTTSVQGGPMSEPLMASSIPEETEEKPSLPTQSSPGRVRFQPQADQNRPSSRPINFTTPAPRLSSLLSAEIRSDQQVVEERSQAAPSAAPRSTAPASDSRSSAAHEKRRAGPASDTSSVILEQAWISKVAGEIARRVYEDKRRKANVWDEHDEAPPAYEAH
jgi:mitochondrial distribution and morphology protein 34